MRKQSGHSLVELMVVLAIVGVIALVSAKSVLTSSTGSSTGKIVDTTWEGTFFKTCEVDVQYGEGSSKIESFSTADKSMCDQIELNNGKEADIKYAERPFLCISCNSNSIIQSITFK